MRRDDVRDRSPQVVSAARRTAVLDAALETFARFGYRKTTMDEVAHAARISRPGLYFLFSSKEELFRAAVTQALHRDLVDVERVLSDHHRALRDRLLDAFDHWAGRYVDPFGRDITTVIDENPGLLADIAETPPRRFQELITGAIAAESGSRAATAIAQTLISTSIGVKHQVDTRDAYLQRLRTAIGLIVET